MLTFLRNLDWKVVLFALVGCYLLPALLLGSLTASVSPEPVMSTRSATLFSVYVLVTYFGAPIVGGYFTAKFATNRPKLHVLIVAALGILLASLSYRGPFLAAFLYAIAVVVLAAMGAFLRLRGHRENDA